MTIEVRASSAAMSADGYGRRSMSHPSVLEPAYPGTDTVRRSAVPIKEEGCTGLSQDGVEMRRVSANVIKAAKLTRLLFMRTP